MVLRGRDLITVENDNNLILADSGYKGAGSGATATATITSGAVTSIAVNTGGTAYPSGTVVVISGGGGSGIRATATVTSGAVTSIAVNTGGTGYTSVPTVTIYNPPDHELPG